jgi:DNA-binding transcriptional MerR regulator
MTKGSPPSFTQAEVVEITGVAPVTLQNWVNRGWIRPEQEGSGKGSRRRYSFGDLFSIAGLMSLTRLGLAPNIVADILNVFEERGGQLLVGRILTNGLKDFPTSFVPGQFWYVFVEPAGDAWNVSKLESDAAGELDIDTSDMRETFIVVQLDMLLSGIIDRVVAARPDLRTLQGGGSDESSDKRRPIDDQTNDD